MKLQRRERILLGATLGLIVVGLVWFLFVAGDAGSMEKLTGERDQQKTEKKKKENDLADAKRAVKQFEEWNSRAVPADPELYKDWLSKLAGQFITTGFKLEATKTDPRGGKVYTTFSFTVKGRASLDNVTKFLYEFYSAGHLHQIRKLDLKPVQNSRDLEVDLQIEALSLPASERTELSTEKGRGLQAGKNRDDYVQLIGKRNVFAQFRPPAPKPPAVDAAQYAFVTGIVEIEGERQVWLQDRKVGKQWRLGAGQNFQIGDANGKIIKIDSPHEVEIEFDGRQRKLREGDNLRGGIEVKTKAVEAKGKEGDAKGKEGDAKGKEVAEKGKEGETKGKDGEPKGKKVEVKGKDGEPKGKKVEAKGKEGEVKGKEGDTKEKKTETKSKEGDAKVTKAETKSKEGEAKETKTETKSKEGDAKVTKAETKSKEGEAKETKTETKSKEGDTKETQTEAKSKEGEAKETKVEAKEKEGDAKEAEVKGKEAEAKGKE